VTVAGNDCHADLRTRKLAACAAIPLENIDALCEGMEEYARRGVELTRPEN